MADDNRFWVDLRGGCVAVRDRTLCNDPDRSGLDRYMPDVVWYRAGYQKPVVVCEACKATRDEWTVSPGDIAEAEMECAKLNAHTEGVPPMSDAKLPAEGVVVLAWWLAEPWPRPSKIMSGKWYAMFGQGWSAAAIPDDGPREYITLDHAKAAGRLAEALTGMIEGAPDDAELASVVVPPGKCVKLVLHVDVDRVRAARAALSEIGT